MFDFIQYKKATLQTIDTSIYLITFSYCLFLHSFFKFLSNHNKLELFGCEFFMLLFLNKTNIIDLNFVKRELVELSNKYDSGSCESG